VSAHQATYPIAVMCRTLGVSPAGYYAWRNRPASARSRTDAALLQRIRTIHASSYSTYGAPRIHAELRAEGHAVGCKRIARLMRAAGLAGVTRRRGIRTTRRDPDGRRAPDLVERDFAVPTVDRLWVADITYIPTLAGFLFLAVVLDAFSRRVVGWSMANHLRTELVLDALNMALWQRRPDAVIHHSDQGSQYTSIAFGTRCREAGVRPSMGSVGDAYDNALCEAFFATLECELIDRRRFRSQAEARMAVFTFIESWYNASSQRTSRYAVEGNRLSWLEAGPAGALTAIRARIRSSQAARPSRSVRRKSHGPSLSGWIAAMSPRCAARRRVFAVTPTTEAACVRLSQGSMPPSVGR
jgi:putative transposase